MTEVQKTVDALLNKAAVAGRSEDALRYSQAALNVAHVERALENR